MTLGKHFMEHRPEFEEKRITNLRTAYARKFPKAPPESVSEDH